MQHTTLHTEIINGIPVSVPNVVDNTPKGYYVSYNNRDVSSYGCDTTAIVNGDHRANLKGLDISQACEYFHQNSDKKNHRSDDHQDDVLRQIGGKWQMVRETELVTV